MSKEGEISYLKNIGPDSVRHAKEKPFSDDQCGGLLTQLGVIMGLLPPPPARLLDMGCGTGWTSCFFAKRGYDVVGQDIAEDMIAIARLNQEGQKLTNLSFVVGDYEGSVFFQEFDCAVFFDALHHAVDETAALRTAYKALKPGGICVASEPGVGHSRSAESKEHMEKYGVTEKDMPPFAIWRVARSVGFKKYRVFPHARHLCNIVFNQAIVTNRLKFLSPVLRLPPFRILLAFYLIIFQKRQSGLVVLVK